MQIQDKQPSPHVSPLKEAASPSLVPFEPQHLPPMLRAHRKRRSRWIVIAALALLSGAGGTGYYVWKQAHPPLPVGISFGNGRIEADKENRRIRDGEVVTACQAVCPTQAITFGDLGNLASRVSAKKASPLNYALLGELNTRPRTTYLARLTNPNPDL